MEGGILVSLLEELPGVRPNDLEREQPDRLFLFDRRLVDFRHCVREIWQTPILLRSSLEFGSGQLFERFHEVFVGDRVHLDVEYDRRDVSVAVRVLSVVEVIEVVHEGFEDLRAVLIGREHVLVAFLEATAEAALEEVGLCTQQGLVRFELLSLAFDDDVGVIL